MRRIVLILLILLLTPAYAADRPPGWPVVTLSAETEATGTRLTIAASEAGALALLLTAVGGDLAEATASGTEQTHCVRVRTTTAEQLRTEVACALWVQLNPDDAPIAQSVTVLIPPGVNRIRLRMEARDYYEPQIAEYLLPSLAPVPPEITAYGCSAAFCALVRHADTITSDVAYTEDEPPPESGYRLLVFAAVPSFIEARGPGGTVSWPSEAPTPLPTRPVPTATPLPYEARALLGVILDGVVVP